MTDYLIKRLRRKNSDGYTNFLGNEAADEIERLREELAASKAREDAYRAEVVKLSGELARAALEKARDAFGEIAWSNNTVWQSDRAKVALADIDAAMKDKP